jgi:hypothetical protein
MQDFIPAAYIDGMAAFIARNNPLAAFRHALFPIDRGGSPAVELRAVARLGALVTL